MANPIDTNASNTPPFHRPEQDGNRQYGQAQDAQPSIASQAMAARRGAHAPDYFEGLNPEQLDAVQTIDGPLLVLAGAGTGKTRVLTTRIAHILATGKAWPSQILAVTFTNKAAREMKERIGRYLGDQVEGMPWLGTFHSIGVKILRRHAELVGLKSDFTILDTDDQIRLLKQLIRAEGIDDKRWPARTLAGLIDGWKNKSLSPKQISEGDARSFGNGKGRELYQMYQDRLKVLNATDFGDLLTETNRLFLENPDVLAQYQQRFKYILVDEYQDTNIAQYMWLRLLSQNTDQTRHENLEHLSQEYNSQSAQALAEKEAGVSQETATGQPRQTNICCVGDDDQSIYGWRGAEVDNILRFEKEFKGAKVIRLERNYRSTEHILGAASQLISHNEGRLGKTLFTEQSNEDDKKVIISACWDSEEEARTVGEEIEQLQRNDQALNEIAILVRASFQMREFEDRFVTLGLNYRVIGGPRFYERREIRDAMAYLRVVSQPADDLAFERIFNTPKRGIGDVTVRKIQEFARAKNKPLMEAARTLTQTDELKAGVRSKIVALLDDFDRWAGMLDNTPHTELTEMILDESGYTEFWQNDKSPDAPGRLENLKELVRSMEGFENLRGFLEHISLVMTVENDEDLDAVSIMTLHSAKGLEFENVFLPGWEEGLFPHQRALDEGGQSGLEEERRLAYVGITRARERCQIIFTSNRRIHGLWQTSIPSRFIDELPPAHVEVSEQNNNYGGYGANRVGGGYGNSRFDTSDPFKSDYSSPGWQRAQKGSSQQGGYQSQTKSSASKQGRTIEGQLTASSINDPSSHFEIGDRVFHLKFGNGNIAGIDGNKLTIDFDKAGQKRVLDSFVEAV